MKPGRSADVSLSHLPTIELLLKTTRYCSDGVQIGLAEVSGREPRPVVDQREEGSVLARLFPRLGLGRGIFTFSWYA
jgi:hypothetical protein